MKLGHWILVVFLVCAFVAPTVGFADPAANADDAAPAHQSKVKKKHAAHAHKAKHGKKMAASSLKPLAALVVDATTAKVLYEKNAGDLRYPASLTKMMTLYIAFDALKNGKLKLEDTFPVSAKAARQPATNISLEPGDRIPVRTAIESVVVRSANDSAMVIAEGLGGTEFNFALMMNQKARALGMKNTVFRNPSGLPDDKQHTTAFDMARLALALRRDFPEYYPFFKMQSFTYNGITYPGHNHVMERYPGVDGIKTGYIRSSGYNLVTSAEHDGQRVVAVVLGGTTISERDNMMISLLDQTFEKMGTDKKNVADGADNDNRETPALVEKEIAPQQIAQGDSAK